MHYLRHLCGDQRHDRRIGLYDLFHDAHGGGALHGPGLFRRGPGRHGLSARRALGGPVPGVDPVDFHRLSQRQLHAAGRVRGSLHYFTDFPQGAFRERMVTDAQKRIPCTLTAPPGAGRPAIGV
ncbi:hypothetical protein DESC_780285 [Desulfosarcina cetonica]|nr:hypothetical protein DESC_780285 [Desulfosarcina cetonica]